MTSASNRILYQKIADDLRSQIARGELRVGDQIPSTTELARASGASATAVRNAVALLREGGLVEGIPGKGVYVVATPQAVDEERATLRSVGEEVARLRQEVRRLSELQPSEVIAKIEELRSDVGKLQADLRHLYDRLGQPYPHGKNDTKQTRRRTSGA